MYVDDFEFKMNDEGQKHERQRHRQIIENMEKELKKLNVQRSKLFDYLEDGTYTKEEFTERKGILVEKIDSLSKALEDEKQNVPQEIELYR